LIKTSLIEYGLRLTILIRYGRSIYDFVDKVCKNVVSKLSDMILEISNDIKRLEKELWIKSSDFRIDDRELDKMVQDMLEKQIHKFISDVILRDLEVSGKLLYLSK
tara:strand:- start:2430 stop:2747 length:318 start_codon:yes stop_codon:yes gene_type:complete